MRLKHAMQTQRRRSLHIGKTHDRHLEECCRGIMLQNAGRLVAQCCGRIVFAVSGYNNK